MIEFKGISQHFRGAGGYDVRALYDVDLIIDRGEIFGIIGRSGADKSALARVINLLNRPTSGTAIVAGQELIALNADGLCQTRHKIGVISQHFDLLSSHTVCNNVALPSGLVGISRERIREIVLLLLELMGLSIHRDRYPAQTSSGQKQRVDTIRTLTSQPNVLLSDEITSALDPETTRSILDLLRKINDELGLTIMLTTHQTEAIKRVCGRVAVLDAGHIVEPGRVIDVFLESGHDVTRALTGEVTSQGLPPSVLTRAESRLTAREQGGRDHLLCLVFAGAGVDQSVLAQAIRDYRLDFSALHDHTDKTQGQAFGPLAILTSGETADIDNAMNPLHEQGVVVEKTNYMV